MSKRLPVSVLGAAVNLVIIAGFVLLFNIYPERVGAWGSALEPSSFTPLLGSGYKIFMPALNLWWLLAFMLNGFHVYIHRWTPATRWLSAALNVYGFILLAWMALGTANFLVPSAMAWFRPTAGLLGLAMLLKACWQVRFMYPGLTDSGSSRLGHDGSPLGGQKQNSTLT